MLRRLPSLNALKAFEAAARHESFTKAADELSVTQGAVSHQVKALELELGLRLFNRERQRLVITDAGRSYLEVVRDAFDRLAVGTNRVLQLQTSGVLAVTTSPNFATKWLVHRLGRFIDAHPEIDLRVSGSHQHVDFAHEDIDLAIRHGDGHWPGLSVTRLCAEELFPVCNPKFLRGRSALRSPADLKRHTLLHVNDRRDWRHTWRSTPPSAGRELPSRAPRSQPGTFVPGGSCAHSRSRSKRRTRIGSYVRSRRPICRRSRSFANGFLPRPQRTRNACEETATTAEGAQHRVGAETSAPRLCPGCACCYSHAPKRGSSGRK